MLPETGSAFADHAIRDVGPWMVSTSSDEQGCFLTRTYPSPRATTLLFGLDVDGSNRLTILNPHWSIREKEELRLTFRLSNVSFPRHFAIGIASGRNKGFVTSFGATFPSDFAASKSLHVRRGDVIVEDLSLDGSGAAVAAMRRCVDQYRGTRTMGRSVRGDAVRIPIDPFATKPKRRSER